MTDHDAYTRLEQALSRVEAAAMQLQRQQARAQARYDLLDRAGSEILAAIDGLLAAPDEVARTGEQPGRPRWIKLAAPEAATVELPMTADAA